MKTVQVRLWRRSPPFAKRVTVGQITVAGFLELLRLMVQKAATVRLEAGHDVTAEDLIRQLREPEFNALADSICKGEPVGFFEEWLSLRNVKAIYAASFRVNNWGRVFSCVDWTAKKKRKGSLMSDIQTISRLYTLDPMKIQEWPMEEFLSFVDAMNLQAQETDEPTPVGVLGMVPGIEIIN